jgi:enoyl-[acyl-carrier protein] reductase II
MLHTTFCDLLGIEVPIIQAPIAPYTSAQLVAAVSNAGGLGSIGTALQSIDDVKKQVDQTRKLTKRPFAINYTSKTFTEESFKFTLEEVKPKIISYALGNPGNLSGRLMMLTSFSYSRSTQSGKHEKPSISELTL